ARLAERAVGGDERRDRILGAERGRQRHLRVGPRRRAARGRERVTAAAAIEVERWPQAVGEVLDLVEGVLAQIEERLLCRRDARNRPTGTGAAAHSRVRLCGCL